MAVPVQTPYIEYTANGSTKSFALEFDCENQDHLIVLVDDVEPVVGTWSLSGGAVVFGTAPTSGKKITVQRNTPFRRDEDFQSYDNSFRPPGVNKGLDKVWLKLQELGVSDWRLGIKIQKFRDDVNLTALENTLEQARDIRDATSVLADEVQDNVTQSGILLANTTAKASAAATSATSANTAKSQAQQAVTDANGIKSDMYTALYSFQNGAIKAYPTLTAANADIANITLDTKVSVLSEENGGDYYKATVGATSLTKSPYDPILQSRNYIDSLSSLTKNGTVLYPFSTMKRNNVAQSDVVATHESYLKPYILNVSITGVDPAKYYRIQQISNPNHATVPNRWIFEVLNKTNFDTAETSEKTIAVVFPIVANNGIKTYTVIDGDIAISVTVDTDKTPTSDFYSVASANSSYTYIIDPSRYIFSALSKSSLNAYVDQYSALTKNGTVLYPFSTMKRNGVDESVIGTHDNILRSYILNARVMNADKTKYYRLQQVTNPDSASNANRWIFEVLNRTNFDTAETVEKTIVTVFPIVKNTGIKTFTVSDGDLIISVTVDTNKTPLNNFYSVAKTENSYTYIIDPSLYAFAAVTTQDVLNVDAKISALSKPAQLSNLLKDLRNPIQSVQITFVGDSITWGIGSSNTVGAGTHTTATPRHWANLLRDYLGTAFCTSSRQGEATIIDDGAAWYTQNGISVFSSELQNYANLNFLNY